MAAPLPVAHTSGTTIVLAVVVATSIVAISEAVDSATLVAAILLATPAMVAAIV